ncbi:type II secretion system F family protein [Companilactobacillus halodurans]|uniref:Competence protein ComG n=1 Tax=Companilactobacillus halodurans TaxID=2584183 RepID=A0A5P0ZYK0_9LACO|nr:type II secretion system F family protein [Companilactobacillus halodurans]MQS76887.1 competence protein ComG [Companilactobacillus halodurans]MQS98119.1 competence protein ComG [Companilactobacillus halodurans]
MTKFIKNIFTDKRIKNSQKGEYLLLISKLLRNGFSLSQSINCLRLLNRNDILFEKIHHDLRYGAMISQSLRHLELPSVVFNQLVIAQDHGKFDLALEQTGILLKNQARQVNKLKELMAYPSFIFAFLMTMLIGMKLYIIPQLELASGGKNIDLFLELIIGLVLGIISVITLLLIRLRKKVEYKRALMIVKLPLIGKIYLSFYQFLILQGLGMQLASGMNLYDICESNKRFQNDSIQGYLSNKCIDGLTNGKSLLKLIEQEPLLPNQLKALLEAGESGPRLAQDLLLMSELKFEETKQGLKKTLNLVQPILFGVIAIVIVVTYLIVLLPIYAMMKGMS